ncbi:MAG: RidA family protein [Solirubrobacteraceae bacterium]
MSGLAELAAGGGGTSEPERRLAELGLRLPPPRQPAGNYVGHVRAGHLLFLSGQGADGHVGRAGADRSIEDARIAARDCALNLLAQAKDALGGLDAIERVVKLTGYVACTEDFRDAPKVLDGASELLCAIFGRDAGAHARAAIGVQALPLGFLVEIEMIVAIKDEA